MSRRGEAKREQQLQWLEHHHVPDKDRHKKPEKKKNAGRKKKIPDKPSPVFFETAVDMEIDLHGYPVDDALIEIEMRLEDLRRAGLSTLRVIHGKPRPGEVTIYKAMRDRLSTVWYRIVERSGLDMGNPGATIFVVKPLK